MDTTGGALADELVLPSKRDPSDINENLVVVENADDTLLLVLGVAFRSPRFQPPNRPNLGAEFVW